MKVALLFKGPDIGSHEHCCCGANRVCHPREAESLRMHQLLSLHHRMPWPLHPPRIPPTFPHAPLTAPLNEQFSIIEPALLTSPAIPPI